MDSINIHENGPGFTLVRHTLIIVSFLVGIGGNIIALWILYTSKNSKHVLMLQCLVTNDLVAEVGMLLVMYLQNYKVIPLYWICVLYVCLRSFGLGSGCVAFVMAIDRWLALTRPFFYQQVITTLFSNVFFFIQVCNLTRMQAFINNFFLNYVLTKYKLL